MPYSPLLVRRVSRIIIASAIFALAGAVSASGAAAAAGVPAAASAPTAKSISGSLRGIYVQNMQAFLGVPYAAAPVGALRWQPPRLHPAWTGTRSATSFANHCPQAAGPFGVASSSEDCLYLNVFAPAGTKAGAKLPVMLWIHGGGFTAGESDDYDPDRLVARGVIVVTLNYRLGYLGFLATAGLDAESHPHVNYGWLDQQFALAWTQANIAQFGGDPTRVTMFGQSAGGASVFAQLFAPGSSRLFARAIVQSGAYDILSLPTLAAAEAGGNVVAAALGCAPADTACLRGASVARILAVQSSSPSPSPLTAGPAPTVDGVFLPLAPQTALAAGKFTHVPVVQGSNHDEFRLFTATLFDLAGGPLTAAEYPLAVRQSLTAIGLGSATNAVLAQYPLAQYASADLAYSAFATDAVFCTEALVSDALLSVRVPAYAYEFSDESAPQDFLPPVSFAYGAAHGSELQFLFDGNGRAAPPLSPNERRLAAVMLGYWTDFAKNGTPNAPGLPVWSPYGGVIDTMKAFVPPGAQTSLTFATEHRTLFWESLFAHALAPGSAARNAYMTFDAALAGARAVRPNARRW